MAYNTKDIAKCKKCRQQYISNITSMDMCGKCDPSGFVFYAIGCENFVKVGFTKNLYLRMTAMATHCPYELVLLVKVGFDKSYQSTSCEALVKKSLNGLGYRHRGEWYRNTRTVLKKIRQIANAYKFKCREPKERIK